MIQDSGGLFSHEPDPLLASTADSGGLGPSLESLPDLDTVLVLGGGAMRGMAHIGVLRALDDLGVKIDAIVGTSIGSLIGALYASSMSPEEMGQVLPSLAKEDYFRLNFAKFLSRGIRAPSMYSGQTFRKSLERLIPPRQFDDLSLPFFCNSVCLETGGPVFFGTRGFRDVPLLEAIYGSCALPGVFEPLAWKGRHFMDGGITDALPLRFAKLLKPRRIIAIDLTVKPSHRVPSYRPHAVATLFRAFDIVENVIMEHSLHAQVTDEVCLVQPKIRDMERFDFDKVQELVEAGYSEAVRAVSSHPMTRGLVRSDVPEGVACPVTAHEYVSLRLDPAACIGCGVCEMTCATGGFEARGDTAVVKKPFNYDCTRDQSCVRACPTGAIRLGNL